MRRDCDLCEASIQSARLLRQPDSPPSQRSFLPCVRYVLPSSIPPLCTRGACHLAVINEEPIITFISSSSSSSLSILPD